MRRWNGWGDARVEAAAPAGSIEFLAARIGPGQPLPDATLEQALSRVPASRMPAHPLVTTAAEDRLRHARGQSLPDWLAMRSGEFGRYPDGVAYPTCSDEVAELLRFAQEQDLVVIPYGGGTSVVGHINPPASERPVLTVDMGRMNRLLDLDRDSQIATFGAGTPGPQLEAQLRPHGYTLGHFPQSFELSTVGGWVASRSSGQQSLRYGRIEQLFAGGRLETLDGTFMLPTLPASSAGPDLRELILGSEGRLGILTEVKVRVTPLPEHESFHAVFFPGWEQARSAARMLVQRRVPLSMIRLSNAVETETQLALAGHPRQVEWLERYLGWRGARAGKCMMTVGITGSRTVCHAARREFRRIVKAHDGVYTGTYLGRKWAEKRFSMPYLRETLWRLGYAVDTLETATDWDNVDRLHDAIEANLRGALQDENVRVHVFTHLSHLYPQGCSIYTTYVFPLAADYAGTLARWERLKHSTSELIVRNRGTVSHQHGVGKDHAPFLPIEKGALGMRTLRTLCASFDPAGRLNPGTLLADED